jgi:hypothetical protein
MSAAPEKKSFIPVLVVAAGLLMYSAPAAIAFADGLVRGDDPCRVQHTTPTARDTDRLAELSVTLMNDPTGGDCTLSAHGLTRDGYVDVVAEVSANRRLADAYNDAFERLQR